MLKQCKTRYVKTTSEENILRKNDIATQQMTKKQVKNVFNQSCQKKLRNKHWTCQEIPSANTSSIFQSVLYVVVGKQEHFGFCENRKNHIKKMDQTETNSHLEEMPRVCAYYCAQL